MSPHEAIRSLYEWRNVDFQEEVVEQFLAALEDFAPDVVLSDFTLPDFDALEALRLLNFGYAAFDTVRLYRQGDVLARAEVWKGDAGEVPIGIGRDVYVTVPTDSLRALGKTGFQSALERDDPLIAPLDRGALVGRLKVTAGGASVATVPVVALESVGEAGLLGRAYDAVRLWWRRRN